jgi:putative ABC transport system substrate-binding protein
MNPKSFLWLFTGILIALSHRADAQQAKQVPRIAYLSLSSGPTLPLKGLLQGLREFGYVDGQNIAIEYRYAAEKQDRLLGLAAELIRLNVSVIFSGTTQAIQTVRNLNATIPIVMTGVSDPIGNGLISSLAHPGNTTGISLYSTELAGKRLQILKEVVPRPMRVAILAYRNHPPTVLLFKETEAAANALKVRLQPLEVEPDDFESAFATMAREHANALIIQQTVVFNPYLKQLAELAVKYRLATIHESNEFVETGGLMSYGPDRFDLGRRAATYVDRILKGAKPADLPVEQPTKFELVINLKTAKQIGLIVPPNILARADRVIR